MTSLSLLLLLQSAHARDRVFDVHVHLWNGEKSVQDYMAQLAETKQKVARFGGIWMANLGKLEETRQKNEELIALSARYPQMIPIGSVHPYDGEAAFDELKRMADGGISVIKLHPHTQKFDASDARVTALCKRAGELGIVILMDNANIIPGDSEKLFNLAVAAPKTRFVLTHMGAMNFRFWNIVPLARTAKDFWPDNLWFEISGTVVLAADSPIEQEFIWTIRNVGIDRVVLGSDFPQLSLAQAVDALERLDLKREEKDKILYGNAEALFTPKKTR
jgi:predicted TIM-barrel fold metal-dependent hydrolase